ncbi:MAG TPA: glycosyltransferase [Armatimonadota bacterium]
MNIAIFSESYKPYVNGVSVSVTTFTEQLRNHGDTVHIFAPYMPDYEDEDPLVTRYPSVRFKSRWLQYEPEYTMALGRFPGLQWILRIGFGATVYRLNTRRALDDMLGRLDIDLIHTQSPFAMGAEGRRWAKRRGVPLVTTFHTLYTEYTHYTPFIPRWISLPSILRWTRMNCNAADRIIAPTEAARDVLASWGVTQPVSILATGIRTAMFRGGDRAGIRERWGIPDGSLVLLYAGRVAPEKNIPLLLDVLENVAASYPDIVLLFAGGGPDLAPTEAAANQRGLGDRVRFAGYAKREEMRDYYAAADILAFPSFTETQGLVLCEAMAAGLPFVAVESPGARSVLPEGYERYLIPNDASLMTQRVLELAGDADKRRRLADLGRDSAERFSEEGAGERLREIYADVIAEKRGR